YSVAIDYVTCTFSYFVFVFFFFFSSRRRHTRSKRDWSSDVCSSDLRFYRLSSNIPPILLGSSRQKTIKPSDSNCCFLFCWSGLSFLPGAFTSLKPIFPFGSNTNRSGNPSKHGDVSLIDKPFIFLTASLNFNSIDFSRIPNSPVPNVFKLSYARICVFA